ncbi:uncharacterized protein LOC142024915 [Carettochelys insculpta]|uniref:uncharacterized protein LOC142024915 n=1 Tax=Carettochelys insculpta TaxID=44489 RepID=UPI003EB8781D
MRPLEGLAPPPIGAQRYPQKEAIFFQERVFQKCANAEREDGHFHHPCQSSDVVHVPTGLRRTWRKRCIRDSCEGEAVAEGSPLAQPLLTDTPEPDPETQPLSRQPDKVDGLSLSTPTEEGGRRLKESDEENGKEAKEGKIQAHLKTLREEREKLLGLKATGEGKSREYLRRTQTERQKIVWEFQQLRQFLGCGSSDPERQEFQSLLVLPTHPVPSCSLRCLQTQPFDEFCHVCQLPVGPEASLLHSLSALRAGGGWVGSLPALADAGSAEVVPTLQSDRGCEILQTDGTCGFFLETFQGAPCSHGSLWAGEQGEFPFPELTLCPTFSKCWAFFPSWN